MRSREEDSLVGRAAFRACFVADSAKQEARLPTNLVPRACVRHSLLPCEQGKRKKTYPRPERRLGYDRGTDRNRRVSAPLSPIFSLFLAPSGTLCLKFQHLLAQDETHDVSPLPIVDKRRPGPKHPAYGIPPSHWPMVIHRVVENNEPLRAVAQEYGVSHETIRRLMLHVQKQRGQQEA